MTVIDVHYHLFGGLRSEQAATAMAESFVALIKREGIEKSVKDVASAYLDAGDDPNGEKLLGRMARIGIDTTVVIVTDNVDLGATEENVLKMNKTCAQLGSQHPGKLVSFAGVDPRREKAPEILRRCIEDYGMKGLKWHPDNGYYPDGPEAYALLEILQEHKLPLLTHTGTFTARNKFAHPLRLDDPTLDFPGVPIIAAHSGHFWWRDWCAIAHFRQNLFGDLAEWQFIAVRHYRRFCQELREAIDIAGADRIMWATDAPVFDPFIPDAEWLQIIRDLPQKAPEGIDFTDEEIAAILGDNARRVLGL